MTNILKKLLLTLTFALFASQASALFIQADWWDPTEPGVGTNRYAYSGNDPVNRLDPNGNYYAEGANSDRHLGIDERDESDVEAFTECTSTHCFSGIVRDDETISTIDGPRVSADNFAAHPGNVGLQAAGVITGEIDAATAMANVGSVFNSLNGGPSVTLRPGSSLNSPIPGRVQSRVNIPNGDKTAGWSHVVDRHYNPQRNASQFTVSQSELRSILQSPQVVGSPITRTLQSNSGLRYERVVTLRSPVGNDKFNSFQPTTTMTVLTDRFGNLVTATPGRLP
jgi:hypothetical protein